ncbi:MAG: hypothetical protein ACFFCW_41165 [Candidatus Hodarchaeota archaeon]
MQLILLFFGILFQVTVSVTAFLNLPRSILCKNLPKNTPYVHSGSLGISREHNVAIWSSAAISLSKPDLSCINIYASICTPHYLWSDLPEVIRGTYETVAE